MVLHCGDRKRFWNCAGLEISRFELRGYDCTTTVVRKRLVEVAHTTDTNSGRRLVTNKTGFPSAQTVALRNCGD